MQITADSVQRGFEHLEILGSLHFHKPPEEQMEAMTLVLESYGMNEEARNKLIESLTGFVPHKLWQARGWVLMGFLAGLASASYAEPD